MSDFLAAAYPWTKSLHVISMVAWMAGLFYLPRLFIYHHQVEGSGTEHQRFVLMERRLLRAIMNPAMIATWVFGLLLVLTPGVVDWRAGWWHAKLSSVLLMTGFHMLLARQRRFFEAGGRPLTERGWRFLNEVPTLLLIVIVTMVIAKPF
ncbi:protoporphyrinogen oxidase HemJ [Sabulicella rubraurantiaca]|uniref:protoporphyrinogen oxidase HemJ n=1 Tax=Sabulicella rubraurantiaca TaxID=2811429 RepID=UPI001A96B044|nr:protoporphyrinogen oxidase HemJ [Sabulicella rubraurantiaca]